MFGNIGSAARLLPIALTLGLATSVARAADPPALQREPAGPAIRQLPPQQVPTPGIKEVPTQRLDVPAVLKGEELTKEQFKALPDSAVVELEGTRITAGQVRAKHREFEAEAQAKAVAVKTDAKFEAYRAKFLQEQKTKLQEAHVKARAEVARLRQAASSGTEQKAIQKEAVELLNRSKTAPPAEQVQIEQRALQLQQRLKTLQQPPR